MSTDYTTFGLPNTIIEIGDYAFEYCTKLKNITLNKGLKKIGNNSFAGKSKIKEMNIPSTVTEIGDSCFVESSIEAINLPNSLKSIGDGAFTKSALKELIIPGSLKTISSSMASEMEKLKTVKICKGVTTICESVFEDSAIYEIELPDTIQEIGYMAFDSTNVKDVTWNGTIKKAKSVEIGKRNEKLVDARWHCNDGDFDGLYALDFGQIVGTWECTHIYGSGIDLDERDLEREKLDDSIIFNLDGTAEVLTRDGKKYNYTWKIENDQILFNDKIWISLTTDGVFEFETDDYN